MITQEMLQTLKSIYLQEKSSGAALAPKIEVYQHRTTLYRALEKLEQLETIQKQEAPNVIQANYTYTTTSFGKKLVKNSQQANIIE